VFAYEGVANDDDPLSPLGLKGGKRVPEFISVSDTGELKSKAQGLGGGLGLTQDGRMKRSELSSCRVDENPQSGEAWVRVLQQGLLLAD
jgi:hypothetical protein